MSANGLPRRHLNAQRARRVRFAPAVQGNCPRREARSLWRRSDGRHRLRPISIAGLLGRLIGTVMLLCSATTAWADVTLMLTTRSAGVDGTETIYVAGDHLRLETAQEGERSAMLFDAASDTLTMLDEQERVFLDFTRESAEQFDRARADQIRAMQSQLEAQLARLPAEERATLEKSLQGDRTPGAVRRRVERTEQKKTIAGFGCLVIEVYVDTEREQTHCVSGRETLGLSEAEFRTLTLLLAALERMAGQDAEVASALGGFPVLTHEYAEGDEILTELKSIRHGPIAPERLRTPAGYRRQEPSPFN